MKPTGLQGKQVLPVPTKATTDRSPDRGQRDQRGILKRSTSMGSHSGMEKTKYTDGERTPLLRSKSVKFEGEEDDEDSGVVADDAGRTRVIPPSRRVVVEPVLVLYVLAAYVMGQCSALYVYDKLLESELNKAGLNVTHVPPGISIGCGGNKSAITDLASRVQSEASSFTGILMVLTGIPASVISLLLGSYSDKAGRRWALIPPLIGGGLRACSFIAVILLDLPVWMLLIGALLDGCGGFLTTLVMGCSSYIADCTTRENRIVRLALVELCSMASIIIAPIGLGFWIKSGGYLYPFIAVACIFAVNLVYVIFFVPETIVRSAGASRPKFFTSEHLLRMRAMYTDDPQRKWKLTLLTVVFMLMAMAFMNMNVDLLFFKNTPLCWDSVMIGYYLAVFVSISGVGGFINAKLMKRCMPDEMIAFVASVAAVGLQLYKSVVINSVMMFFASAFGVFSFLGMPSIRALMSKLVKESEQGTLFGAIATVEMLAMCLGGFAVSYIYSATQQVWSGLVFIVLGGAVAIASILLGVYMCKVRKTSRLQRVMTDVEIRVDVAKAPAEVSAMTSNS